MNTFWKRTFLYLSSTLMVVILALVLEGKIVFSLPDKKENCTEKHTITIPILNDNYTTQQLQYPFCANRFEKDSSQIDGISFEYVENHVTVMSPPKNSDARTDAKIAMIVSNNRDQPIRFNTTNFRLLFLQWDNTPFSMRVFRQGIVILHHREEDYPLIKPRESIILTWDISLQWKENDFLFDLKDKYNNTWIDRNFKYDRLKVYFNYYFKKVPEFYLGSYGFLQPISELGEIWTGSFCTTPVEVQLIDRLEIN